MEVLSVSGCGSNVGNVLLESPAEKVQPHQADDEVGNATVEIVGA
jgi:hypothetical protein